MKKFMAIVSVASFLLSAYAFKFLIDQPELWTNATAQFWGPILGWLFIGSWIILCMIVFVEEEY